MIKDCSTCRYAVYDSVPYGSTNASYLSGCEREDDDAFEDLDFDAEVFECPLWAPCAEY